MYMYRYILQFICFKSVTDIHKSMVMVTLLVKRIKRMYLVELFEDFIYLIITARLVLTDSVMEKDASSPQVIFDNISSWSKLSKGSRPVPN